MMEENNKGKGFGIFYAVVGVATLVVAIIGATFAFFSASQTNNTAIDGTTASAGGLSLSVLEITDKTSKNFIPVNFIPSQKGDGSKDSATSQFKDAVDANKGGVCKDTNGNNVCAIYRIDVGNLSTTSKIQVRGTLTLTSTAENVYWKLIKASDTYQENYEVNNQTVETLKAANIKATGAEEVKYSTDVKGTSNGALGNITVGGNSGVEGKTDDKNVWSKDLLFEHPKNKMTYYVIVWLEETGVKQELTDASKKFSGVVTFNAVDANGEESGITASFSSAK